MTAPLQVDAAILSTVTVTFNSDIALLETQFRSLPHSCTKFIVDNASRPELFAQMETLAKRVANVRLLRNDSNTGLAAAVNRGVRTASELTPAPEFVLLLDQDSEPQAGSVEILLEAFRELEQRGEKVGCVGPLLLDPETGLTHGFHQCTRWRWMRVYPSAGSATPVSCANLNGSGTMVRTELFQRLGGLDEPLFIDHVDTEWAFRVLANGYSLWGIPGAVFQHRMGQKSIRFWLFGWRVWPSRSPQRHFYVFRNATTLLRRNYVPKAWKVWAVVKLVLIASVHGLCDHQRRQQLRQMWLGVRAASSRNDRREN